MGGGQGVLYGTGRGIIVGGWQPKNDFIVLGLRAKKSTRKNLDISQSLLYYFFV